MIEYIYFVKCPDCEDEHFSFFNDAKEYALGCLGNKPVITQTEVCRNDFGECTDSNDLGTIWSWEAMMTDVSADEPTVSVFTHDDFAEYNPDRDPEFDALDNSVNFVPTELDSAPDNFRKPIVEGNAVLAATRAPKDSDFIIVSKHADGSYSFLGNNYRMTKQLDNAMTYPGKINAEYDIKYAEDQAEASSTNIDKYTYNPFFVTTFGEARKLIDDRDAYIKQRDAKAATRSSLNAEVRNLAREMYDQGTPCNSFEEFETFMLSKGYDKPTKYLYYGTYRDELKRCAKMSKLKGLTRVEAFERKAIPDGMTIEQLVEEMEENEDMVECVCCQELFPKEDCKYDKKHGWLCPDCEDNVVECTWCEELFDKSECRYEVDLGWLCSRCEAAIKSRGETLTFRESNYWDFLDEDCSVKESFNPNETVKFKYDELDVTLYSTHLDHETGYYNKEHEETLYNHTYQVSKGDVATDLWENELITEEDVTDVPGGLEALEDDDTWKSFLETHFDALLDKYYDKLLEIYRDQAAKEFEEKTSYEDYWQAGYEDYLASRYDESLTPASKLEELEESEDYKKRLSLCPECGSNSFDPETGFCINCGFEL